MVVIYKRKRNKSLIKNRATSKFSAFQSVRNIRAVNMKSFDKDINIPLSFEELSSGTNMGIDSHADTTCVNKHAFIESIVEGFTVDAIPFDKSIGKLTDLPIVNAIYAYDNQTDMTTHLLRFNQAIYVKHMDNALLCPNQAREHGIIVDDIPKRLDHNGSSTFSIITPNLSCILQSNGPTAYLPLRRPTTEELDNLYDDIIDITDDSGWDPYNDPQTKHKHVSSLSTLNNSEIDDLLLNYHNRKICAITIKPKNSLTPEYLSQIWHCGLETAKKTIEASTCSHYRNVVKGLTKRFKPARNFMRYRQIRLPAGEFYTDTMMAKVRSIRGHTCAQVYGNKFGFIKSYLMDDHNMQSVGDTLSLMIQDVGVVQKLHTDNAPEMIGRRTPFFKRARKEGIDLTTIEPLRPDENYGEILVKKAKIMSSKLMTRRNVPLKLWCYALDYACDLESIKVPVMYRNRGRTGYEIIFGSTPDISEYVEFEFYDHCWYWDTPQSYPNEKKSLGRWLGVAHRVGQSMVYYIMNANGKVITRSTVSRLDPPDYDVDEYKIRITKLDARIESTIGDYRNALNVSSTQLPEMDSNDLESQLSFCFDIKHSDINDDKEEAASNMEIPHIEDSPTDDLESSEFDKFLGIYVELPGDDGESKVLGRVKNRKRDHDGRLIGITNPNPVLNTAIYNIETPDGNIQEYTANVIAENLWNQVDDDGYDYSLNFEIIGHRKDDSAIAKANGYYETKSGTRRRVITSKGWDLHIRWETGETSYIALKDIKECNPIAVAEYAFASNINDEPAFAWWVRTVIKRRDVMVSKVARRVRKNMKFGIKIPVDYDEAVKFDRENNNKLWQESIKKEMKNVQVAFKFNDDNESIPIGFKKITCHIIFDVKFDLTRKARYVAGGHLTKVSPSMSYSSVVSRDSVRIMFLVAALNDLDIQMCDIGSAYLNAETRERVWFKAGAEWGDVRAGSQVIIIRALYGLKSSGAEWKKTFSDYIKYTLGYEPCVGADDNIYLRAEKTSDGQEYYSYLVVYVDDVLCINKDPKKVLDMINRDYRLKELPAQPTMYLGADISKYNINRVGTTCWAMSSDSHIKKALDVVTNRMRECGVTFKSSNKTTEHPFSSQSYRPELDISEECDEDQVEFYQSLVGILRWLCEIGRLDILTETSLLSTYLTCPRVGHLHQALHVFKYLSDHKRSKVVFDPNYVDINDNHLPHEERAINKAKFMSELYPDAVEEIPTNAPKPRGRPVQITCFVDADHGGDKITRRSRTGVLIMINKAPIMWYSKRQNTVETSTYGSELVAMRLAVEMIKALKYKLRMFGIEILEDETKIFGDNNAVIINTSVPESTLKKKHHSINYNYIRESVAAGIVLIYKVDTGSNLADLFTKLLDRVRRKDMVQKILR